MISSPDWLTPTRASGIAAYGLALACCAIAWTKSRPNFSRITAAFAAIEALLLLDILTDGRWRLHQLIGNFAQLHHQYALRRLPQSIADLVLLLFLLLSVLRTATLFRHSSGLRFAACGTLLSVLTWCVEVVSLHQVDTLLYHQWGEWMVVGFVWILASVMTSIGILIAARDVSRYPSQHRTE